MDTVLVALGIAIPLILALSWAIWYLYARCRKNRRYVNNHRSPAHLFRGQGEAITVAELLEDAIEAGTALSLAWPTEDRDQNLGPVRPYVQDQFPTAILPIVDDGGIS